MAKSKKIVTSRLLIEPFSLKYLTLEYISWLNNPLVVRYSRHRGKKHTLGSCRKYFNSYKNSPHYFWAISVVNPKLGHIGNINAYIDKKNNSADLGILIGQTKAWGKGYASEAWNAICRFLFKELKISKITAGCLAANKRMVNLMAKTGMVIDKQSVTQNYRHGKAINTIHAKLLKRHF